MQLLCYEPTGFTATGPLHARRSGSGPTPCHLICTHAHRARSCHATDRRGCAARPCRRVTPMQQFRAHPRSCGPNATDVLSEFRQLQLRQKAWTATDQVDAIDQNSRQRRLQP
eukprot:5375208-Prymnesium_polylepis.1